MPADYSTGKLTDQQDPICTVGTSSEAARGPAAVVRRRNRHINSCLECRRRKLKCDKQSPCANCIRSRRDCVHIAASMDTQSQQRLADIKEKIGKLEKSIEQEVASQAVRSYTSDDRTSELVPGNSQLEDPANKNSPNDLLEPPPLAIQDNVYENTTDDELMDLGVQMGKMRISERIGGWIHPKLVDELTNILRLDAQPSKLPVTEAPPKSHTGPPPDYIAPTSNFLFLSPNNSNSIYDFLPDRSTADRLISQYWQAVHHMCKAVHRPTFEGQYTDFWTKLATGSEPAAQYQAIVFAAMFAAAVSMTSEQTLQSFSVPKSVLVCRLRSGTESALAKANCLATTKLDTMQAFVMYLIPLIRADVSRAHSTLVGCAIRLAGRYTSPAHAMVPAVLSRLKDR